MGELIGEMIKRSYKNLSEFARVNDIPYGTLYDVVKGKTRFENIGVSVFIKIAQGLNMTPEELYYGEGQTNPHNYTDPRQIALNMYYESMNEAGKETLVASARLMAGSPDVRMEKNNGEDIPFQAAMGA